MTTLTWHREYETEKSNVVEHGVTDAKGRAIGSYATVAESPLMVENPERPGRWMQSGKVEFWLRIYATRNGARFGATPHPSKFPTMEAAKAAAEKKLAEAGKRFAKAVAAGKGRQYGGA